MKLNLVIRRNDVGLGQQFLKCLDGEVRDSNRLHLPYRIELVPMKTDGDTINSLRKSEIIPTHILTRLE